MIADELPAGLADMTIDQLRATWTQLVGQPVPKLRQRELMALALAYRLQARIHGDLAGPLKRRLAELGRRFIEDRNYQPTPGQALKPGSSLIKDWRGERHEVRVQPDGFSYQGERFGSLSEVAQRITGTKWNGQVFFGLKARRR